MGIVSHWFRWERARRVAGEPFGFNAESVVEPRPVVFPGDAGRKFDELPMIELRSQLEKQLVFNLDRRTRDRYGVAQHQAFDIREHGARFVFAQCLEFLIR